MQNFLRHLRTGQTQNVVAAGISHTFDLPIDLSLT